MDTLTKEMLDAMKPGVFASGTTTNNPSGVYMTNANLDRTLLWIAKRGAIHDWTIYIGWAEPQHGDDPFSPIGFDQILTSGDKVSGNENIKKLVPCTEGALNLYRR